MKMKIHDPARPFYQLWNLHSLPLTLHDPIPGTQVSELTVLTKTSSHCCGDPTLIEIADHTPSSPYLLDN
jgi:hypothetical protein